MKLHTDREYEGQLNSLRQRILLMAGRVEGMIGSSVQALIDRDVDLAKKTIAVDQKVNRDEVEMDDLCLVILAKRQPMGSDLRFIAFILKMVTDLERIGDLAVNISERAIDLAGQPPIQTWEDISRMTALVQSRLRDAIDAFVEKDTEKAQAVIDRDSEVDHLYTRIFRDVLSLMLADGAMVERGIHVQSVAKWLERIADHTTNLAEQVIFMVKGKDVRHAGKLPRE